MQDKKIFLLGGGTAGHIYPLFAVVEKLRLSDKYRFDFTYFGSGREIEKNTAKKYKVHYQTLICGKFRRSVSILSVLENIIDLLLVVAGIVQSIVVFLNNKPDIIFSKSGYVSVPMVAASRLFSVPVIAHESDLVAGLSTKLILPYVKRLAVAFPISNYSRAIATKAFYAGVPLRKEFDDQRNLREKFILVIGGSSGAVDLNSDFFSIAEDVLSNHDVVHVTGQIDYGRAVRFKSTLSKKLADRYEVSAYVQNMDELIRRSEFVISRAGATTVFEIAAFNKKAIFVPISKSVTDHQSINSIFLKQNKMGLIYSHDEGPGQLLDRISKIESFETEIAKLSFPLSSELIASVIIDEFEYQNFKTSKSIFMIGIAGVSMKGLANILKSMGKTVTGSDAKIGGHLATNINIGQDLVIYSSAASPRSDAKVEHERAQDLHIPTMKRSQAIGALLRGYQAVSVSGMHGKTTTSSMLSKALSLSGFSPSFLIGADSTQSNPTSHLGSGSLFVVEACEYDGSFLDLPTFSAIITNIEEEHLDYFKGGISQIYNEFGRFIEKIYPGGLLVYCADDKHSLQLISKHVESLKKRNISLISYGFKPSANFSIRDYKTNEEGISFKIKHAKETLEFESGAMGQHLALDYAAVTAVCNHYGLSKFEIEQSFRLFTGASRRFEYIGERSGVKIFDDYGHHPTEIETTLQGLNERFPKARKFVIYEPHQQNRMNNFFDDFVRVFKNSKVERVVVLPVHIVAGRDDKTGKSSNDLVEAINKSSERAVLAGDYDGARAFISENVRKGDIVLTMGATNVYEIGKKYFLEG
jgi:UDP-N-acetylmuramate--alanine ligase